MKSLDYIRVVLVAPSHAGNIGATARAMANMGVANLTLVAPRDFPSGEATARAAGADHILAGAVVADDLDAAIADCELVVGASARPRAIEWPQLSPASAMRKVAQSAAPVALLFGRESSGLTNRELDRCHYLVRIPADPAHPSLNLAAAVMVLLYELRRAVGGGDGVAAADDGDTAVANGADGDGAGANGNAAGVVGAGVGGTAGDHADGNAVAGDGVGVAGVGASDGAGDVAAGGVGVGVVGAADAVVTDNEPIATAEQLHHFHQHLQQLLATLQFPTGNADKLHRKLIRLFNRARPRALELRILRGIFTAVEEKINRR